MENNLQDILGLTLNESRVYSALIRGVLIEVSDLTKETELPRSRIYEVLSSLAAKNLIEKKDNGYRLIPPQVSIPNLLKELDKNHQVKLNRIRELGDYLTNVWHDSSISNVSPGVDIFALEDGESLFLEHLKGVKSKVWIAAGANRASIDMRRSGSVLASVYKEKMDIKYLVSSKEIGEKIKIGFSHFAPFKNLKIKIRSNSNLFSSYVLIDEILYIFFFGGNGVLEATTLRTTSQDLIKSFNWMFSKLWDNGIEH